MAWRLLDLRVCGDFRQVLKIHSDILPHFKTQTICNQDAFKKGDAVSSLLFNFALQCVITRVHVNYDSLKFNGTHQVWFMLVMLIYWAETYILLKSTEALVVASKKMGLDANAGKTK